MIRVNLAENAKKRAVTEGSKRSFSFQPMPIVHFLIFAGAVAGGFFWYTSLNDQGAALKSSIEQKTNRLKILKDAIEVGENLTKAKDAANARLKGVETLRTKQVSPVVALDKLAEAIRLTTQPELKQFVWLNSLEQDNTKFDIKGVSTSVDGVAAFIKNLEATGHFKVVPQFNAQDSAGNFNFNLTCEYAPPGGTAKAGAN